MKQMQSRWKGVLALTCAAMMIACVALLFTGCGSGNASSKASGGNASTAGTRIFTDDLGRKVEIPNSVDKIVPSGHTTTPVLLSIAPEKMVGLSQELTADQKKYINGDYSKLPILGAIFGAKGDLNKEAVAATGAQLLIDVGGKKDGMAEDLDKLQEQLGIPCIHIEATLDTWDQAFTKLGEVLGVQARAKELGDYCAKAYKTTSDVMSKIPEPERANIAYLLGDSGLNAIAKGSAGQGDVVDMCANNVAVVEKATAKGTGNEVSMEQISTWNPDVIVFGPQSAYDQAKSDPVWGEISAVKNGKVYEVPSVPYNWLSGPPTVNQVMGMQWLPRLLYPGKFSDSIEDVTKSYYKAFYQHDLTDAELNELLAKAK